MVMEHQLQQLLAVWAELYQRLVLMMTVGPSCLDLRLQQHQASCQIDAYAVLSF